MKFIKIGKILKTHGLRGQVSVLPLTDYVERFEEVGWVYIEGIKGKLYIKDVRYRPKDVLISFDGYNNITQVEQFKGQYLLIEEMQKRDLPRNTYYISDIIGLEAYTVDKRYLGKVVDILQAGSNEVYIIKDKDKKEIMIPAVREFIPEISLEEGKIIINPIEGMIE